MGIRFNVDEVLEMAERIEANGAAFYRRAAQLHAAASDDTSFLLALAAMEDEHLIVFREMRSELSDKEKELTAYDPNGEAALYLEALADAHGGEGAPAIADTLTGDESVEDILRTAVDLEKKAVLFYLGLRDAVPAKLGGRRIERIIDEEKKHIVVLTTHLKARKQRG